MDINIDIICIRIHVNQNVTGNRVPWPQNRNNKRIRVRKLALLVFELILFSLYQLKLKPLQPTSTLCIYIYIYMFFKYLQVHNQHAPLNAFCFLRRSISPSLPFCRIHWKLLWDPESRARIISTYICTYAWKIYLSYN